jgi:hypothetical protein
MKFMGQHRDSLDLLTSLKALSSSAAWRYITGERRVQEVGYKLFILPGTVAIQRSDIDDDDLEQVS